MLAPNELIERFTGRSLTAYLARGGIAVALLAAGFWLAPDRPYVGLFIALLALVPIGGCPACWVGGTIGAACELGTRRKIRHGE